MLHPLPTSYHRMYVAYISSCLSNLSCQLIGVLKIETEQRCLNPGFGGILRKPIVLSALRDFLESQMQHKSPRELTLPREIMSIETDFCVARHPPPKADLDAPTSKFSLLQTPNIVEPEDPGDQLCYPDL